MYMYKSMELYCKTDENPADIVTRISKHDLLKIIYGGKDLCVLKNASIENNISKSNSNTKLEKVIPLHRSFKKKSKSVATPIC